MSSTSVRTSPWGAGPFDLIRAQLGTGGAVRQMQSVHNTDAAPTGAGDLTTQAGGGAVQGVATGTGSLAEAKAAETSGASGGPGLGAKLSGALHSLAGGAKTSLSTMAEGVGGAMRGVDTSPVMTSAHGYPWGARGTSLHIGGHPLVSDLVLMEHQQAFNRAKTLERQVHACGSGAMGHFRVTNPDISRLCKAAFLKPGATTPVAARFSTTTFGREFPDEARNPRGLAFKFYTEEGNYDLLSINFPTFFVRDGILGPDAIRTQQRNPQSFQVNFDAMFDFMSLVPESMLANLWFWSDHGTPRGWMHMDGYPIHTFKWVSDSGKVTYVKYKLVSQQGIQNLTQAEAQRISGIDPDFSKREMFQHINSGGVAEWVMRVQMLPEEDMDKCPVDPFDCARVWPESQFPWVEVGRITLDRNVENYHRDTEQIAFSPGRLVPGIEPTPDPLLQFRLWLYQDAQMHRLGVNYHQIPVNCPFMARQYHPQTRDGPMRVDANGSHESHYFPNSFRGAACPRPDERALWKPSLVPAGLPAAASRVPPVRDITDPRSDYIQAESFWRDGLGDAGRENLYQNIAYSLRTVTRKEVQLRWLMALYRVNPACAQGVMRALEAECERAQTKPQIGWDDVEAAMRKMGNTPLVDVANNYTPAPIDV